MKHAIIIVLVLFLGLKSFAQDYVVNQIDAYKTYLNPAYVADPDASSATLNYRNQWPDMAGNYVNYYFSGAYLIEKYNSGLGLNIMNQTQGKGMMNNLNADLIYGYRVELSPYSLFGLAAQASLYTHMVNGSKFIYGDMLNTNTGEFSLSSSDYTSSKTTLTPDFSAAALFKHWDHFRDIHYYAGFSVHHLTEPTYTTNSKLYRKYSGFVYAKLPLLKDRLGKNYIGLRPKLMYQRQNFYDYISYGTDITLYNFFIGALFRHSLSQGILTYCLSLGGEINNYIIMYTYDNNSGKDYYLSYLGGHEISISMKIDPTSKKRKRKY